MRLEGVGATTGLLAATALWAVLVWVLALFGLAGRVAPLPDDPSLAQALPDAPEPAAERLGPPTQYAEIGERPLFAEDRRHRPFLIDGNGEEVAAPTFDLVLTSVLIAPPLQMAIVQPRDGGEPLRVRVGESPRGFGGWTLSSVAPRSARRPRRRPSRRRRRRMPRAARRRRRPRRPRRTPPRPPTARSAPNPAPRARPRRSAAASRPAARACARNRPPSSRTRRVPAMTRTSRAPFLHALAIGLLATLLAACATAPMPDIRRDGAAVPRAAAAVEREPLEEDDLGPRAQIRRGTQQTINRSVAASAPPNLAGTSGEATFNFEGESVHAVVKAVLGDMLGQNYVIAPEVQGTVTLATPRPVSPAQALSLLEMVLGWNNARMIYSDGRYNIVPADGALATGAVAPRTGGAATARGFEARTVQLRYISATEMEKVLEPYARPNAIVNVDNARNVITVAGTRGELENYLRTIEIFDVDWLAGMSVGVFPLESGRASQVVADLEKVFGEESNSPVAGMFRFLPLEGANAVMVITAQPSYLDEIQRWLERIDGAGGESRLFSYELKYIKAAELAERLAQVFGAGGRRGGEGGSASLMPGTSPMGLGGQNLDERRDGASLTGNDGMSGGGSGFGGTSGGFEGQMSLNPQQQGTASVTLEVDGTQVGVSAVDETNTLLVRATAGAWKSIREVVDRLDVMPMQVHIEAQVAEVALNGELRYGVNWFIENGGQQEFGLPSLSLRDNPLLPRQWSTFGGNIIGSGERRGVSWTLFKNDAAAIISALDEVTDIRLLQTPSVFVRNNAEATFNVGSRIPISSVSVNPIFGSTDNAISQVQYIDTGIILKVRPRVTKDGMVFLDIVQEVSSPLSERDANGNVRIDTRRLKTEAAVQTGDTVMLAGLISDQNERGSTGLPGLSRIPVIGALFGQQRNRNERTEVIILLTPTIVRDPLEARRLTDEYSRRFQALEPLRQQEARQAERQRRQAEREAADAARRGEPAGAGTDGVE